MVRDPGREETHVAAGAEVYSRDGHRLGAVKEVRKTFFKVDAPAHPDYWLDGGDVASATPSRVDMQFDRGKLDDFIVLEPGPSQL